MRFSQALNNFFVMEKRKILKNSFNIFQIF